MSTIYDKTDNYALNLYGDKDPADLRDGYNGSMRTIDDTLENHLNRIEDVEARETHDEEVMKTLLGDNTVDSATAAKTKWDKAGADARDAISLLSSMGVHDAVTATAFVANCNAVLHGVANDGSRGVSDSINRYIANTPYNGIYFPAGTYLIDKTINIPLTTSRFSFYADPNAKFIATNEMSNMFQVGTDSTDASQAYGSTIVGGLFDCDGKCDNCWNFSKTVYGMTVGDMEIRNARHASFLSQRTQPLDIMFSNIRINNLKNHTITSDYGFCLDGTDCQFSNIYTTYCRTHFKCGGGMMFDTIHSFNSVDIANAVCFDLANGRYLASNIYIDSIAIGVSSKYIDAYFTNVYHYTYAKLNTDTFTFKVGYNANLHCDGLNANFREDTHAATPLVGVKDGQLTFALTAAKFADVNTNGDNCLMPVMPNYGATRYESSLFYGVTSTSPDDYIMIGVLYEDLGDSLSSLISKSIEPSGEIFIEIDQTKNPISIYLRNKTFTGNAMKFSNNGFLYDSGNAFTLCLGEVQANKLGLRYRAVYLKKTSISMNKAYRKIDVLPSRNGITFIPKGGIETTTPTITAKTTPTIITIQAASA